MRIKLIVSVIYACFLSGCYGLGANVTQRSFVIEKFETKLSGKKPNCKDAKSEVEFAYEAKCEIKDFPPQDWNLDDSNIGDSMSIFVSADGDDNSTGGSEQHPVRTLKIGTSRLRDHSADRLLLKCGDIWESESLGFLNKSGASQTAPLVVSAYGDCINNNAPLIITGNHHGVEITSPIENVYIEGLHFKSGYDPIQVSAVGIRILAGKNIRLESNYIEGFRLGVVAQAYFGDIENVYLYRNIIADNAAPGRSQGLYAEYTSKLVLDSNTFDHNGWIEGTVEPSIQSHNVYLHISNECVFVKNNIFARAASHGGQFRSGGIIANNFFIQNPDNSLGYVLGGSDPKPNGIVGVFRDNVVTEGTDISITKPRGFGLEVANSKELLIEGNLFFKYASSKPYGMGIYLIDSNGIGIHKTEIQNNIFYDWHNPILIARSDIEKMTEVKIEKNLLIDRGGSNRSPEGLIVLNSVIPGLDLSHFEPGMIELAENSYYSSAPRDHFFSLMERLIEGGTSKQYFDFDEWENWSNEINGTELGFDEVRSIVDAEPSVLEYVSSCCADLGVEREPDAGPDPLMTLRRQRRQSWNPQLEASAINRYYFSQFKNPHR